MDKANFSSLCKYPSITVFVYSLNIAFSSTDNILINYTIVGFELK